MKYKLLMLFVLGIFYSVTSHSITELYTLQITQPQQLVMYKNDKIYFEINSADVIGYKQVSQFNYNNDGIPDFVYAVEFEEYTNFDFLISVKNEKGEVSFIAKTVIENMGLQDIDLPEHKNGAILKYFVINEKTKTITTFVYKGKYTAHTSITDTIKYNNSMFKKE